MPPKKAQRSTSKLDIDFKLKVLRDSRRLMNISKAANESGVSRTTIYRWKKQYIEQGEKGLETKKRNQSRRTQRVTEVVEAVISLAKRSPDLGCSKIAKELSTLGKKISSPTVQEILIDHDLATQADRSRILENEWMDGKFNPTAEQYKAMLRHNPCLSDRGFYRPPFYIQAVGVGVCPLKGQIGKLTCSIVVTIDLASLFAKCIVWDGKRDRQSKIALQEQVHQNVVLFRDNLKQKQTLHVIYTSTTAYQPHSFANILNIRSIKISGGAQIVGAIRYFFQLLEDEFFPIVRNDPEIMDLDMLDQRLQAWLDDYNMKHKRAGFPTFGFAPHECRSEITPTFSFCRTLPLDTP
jgi:transposase-like protein